MNPINAQKVAVLSGDGTSSLSFGEIWHFFETQLKYPLTILDTDYFSSVDLSNYDVLVLSAGSYGRFTDKILDFVRGGGKVIAMERAMSLFSNARKDDNPQTQLGRDLAKMRKAENKDKKPSDDPDDTLQRYEDRRRSFLTNSVEGSIYKVSLDDSHPLSFGLGA